MKRDFCLVFELLDKSLCDFMKKRCPLSLRMAEIRVVMQQMLVTLKALTHSGVIHCDIKPDNITLVNHTALSFKIKLSNFGLAQKVSKNNLGHQSTSSWLQNSRDLPGLPIK